MLVQPIPSDAALIDFNAVPFRQEHIHERLVNWARWVRPRRSSWVHPMWRGFKPSEVWAGTAVSIPINTLDAQAVEKAISGLPDAHRFSVRWCYVYGGNPRRAAREVGETLEGLAALISAARAMLINRGV